MHRANRLRAPFLGALLILLTACSVAPPPVSSPEPEAISAAHESQPAPDRPAAEPLLVADLDGDGRLDQIHTDGERVEIVSGTGEVLYAAPIKRSQPPEVKTYPLPDGTQLIHLRYGGWCLRLAPSNLLLGYDRTANRMVPHVDDPDQNWGCGGYDYLGDGRFQHFTSVSPVSYEYAWEWQGSQFQSALVKVQFAGEGVETYSLPHALETLSAGDISGAAELFASPELYSQFRERLGEGGWRFSKITTAEEDGQVKFRLSGPNGEQQELTVLYRYRDPNWQRYIVITGLIWTP